MSPPLRLSCLASGGGRTILNLLDSIEDGQINAAIQEVLVSSTSAAAVHRCQSRGLKTFTRPIDEDLDTWVLGCLEQSQPDLVCLCGYLRLLPMPTWLQGRVINIHPALLPNFGGPGMYGQHVHAAVLESGATESGCTVHFVDAQYDHGETILQRRCKVCPDDDVSALAARVFAQECIALPEAVQAIADSRATD